MTAAARVMAVAMMAMVATAAVAAGQTVPPASGSNSGSRAGYGGPNCKTDADCPASYCLNYAPHLEPYLCHNTDFPLCFEFLKCQHGGSIYQHGCNATSDCPTGSYCMMEAPHKAPYTCHSQDAPTCACSCLMGWEGEVCDSWNGGSSGGGGGGSGGNSGINNRIDAFMAWAAAGERSDLQQQQQFYNPFAGTLGYGFDLTTGDLRMPVLELDFSDPTKTLGGYRLPKSAAVTQASSTARTVTQFNGINDLRAAVSGAVSDAASEPANLFSAYAPAGVAAAEGMLTGQYAWGFVSQEFVRYSMTLDQSAPTYLQRYFRAVTEALPTDYDSDTAQHALNDLVSTWGTHYIVAADLGGELSMNIQFDYQMLQSPAWANVANLPAYLEADFTAVSGMAADGTPVSPASASATVNGNANYANHRLPGPVSCRGGNAVEQCTSNFQAWVNSLNPSSVAPIRVQLRPISDLLEQGPQQAALESAIQEMVASKVASWNNLATCPACSRGSCGAGQEACACPNGQTAGRMCQTCESGWNGASCTSPICLGCNVGGGSCVAPGQCQCHACYAGPQCDSYTCGCFADDSTVLRADNTTVALTSVRMGDMVQSINAAGELEFSPVYYVREFNQAGANAKLVELTVEGAARALRLTTDHLVYVSRFWAPSATVAAAEEMMAADVKVGMYVWYAEGQKLALRRVDAVEVRDSVQRFVSVHTLAGPVVVDGVLASSYEWSSWWAALDNFELRTMFKYFPAVATSEWYQSHVAAWDDAVAEPIAATLRAVSEWVSSMQVPSALMSVFRTASA